MAASAPFSIVPALETAELVELRSELEHDLRRLTMTAGLSEGGTALLDRWAQVRSRTILSALARIEDGTYGTCLVCRGAIPYPRLLAIPEATTCVGCTGGVQ